jgi:hypothetical protein
VSGKDDHFRVLKALDEIRTFFGKNCTDKKIPWQNSKEPTLKI